MTTELNPVDKWKNIPWRKLRKVVFRLQVRIFKAQKNGNLRLVRKLQKLLLSSKAAKLLAIRQVTQLNMGKKTAGVDGKPLNHPKDLLFMSSYQRTGSVGNTNS